MRLRTVALTCLFVSCFVAAHGSASKPVILNPQSTNTLQGVEGGFWRIDNNFDPILHLKNVLLKTPLHVTPFLFFADGTEYKLPAVRLEPAGVASIDLRLAIQHAPPELQSHISNFGMLGISYRWAWPAVTVSIQNTDEIASLSGVSAPHGETRRVHQQPEVATAQVIRGTWWLPTKVSDDVIALGNTGLFAKQVRVRISDNRGGLLTEKHVTLEAHSSRLLRLNEILSSNFRAGDAGDITILYSGAPHSLVASASIEDETTGYSVTPHMVEQTPDPDEIDHGVTVHAPGIMLGKPEASMLFPVDTVFTPYAVLHNLSSQSIAASLSLTSGDANQSPVTRHLDTINISAGSSVVVDMSRYFDAGHPLPNGYGHLSVSYSGKNEDLLFDTGSADQSGNYVFQVMPSLEAPTIHKILCFWSVEGDTSTMISIWNYAATPQDTTLLLHYSGGQYRIPLHLGPRQTYNLDMMSLVRSRVPDADGKLIPAYITTGSATLVGPGGDFDPMTLVVSASAYNVRNATCYPICIDCGGIVSISVNNVSVALQHTAQASATITTESGSSTATSGNWSSANSSIANIDGSGDVGGIALGSTTIYLSLSAPPAGLYCYQMNQTVCPYNNTQGSGSVTVVDETPVISSISPSVWNANSSLTITISGQHFGTNQPVSLTQVGFSDNRITATSYPQWTDTQIQAFINVPARVNTESVGLTVTSTGYGNQAFNGQQAGQSPTSGQVSANVNGMPAAAPNIKFNGADIVGSPQSVVVGQQIVLNEDVPSPQNANIASRSWSISTGTAVSNYLASTASGSVSLLPYTSNTASYTLHWVYPGQSLKVAYFYTLTNGNQSPTVYATFNVTGGGTMTNAHYAKVTIDNLQPCGGGTAAAAMVYGNITGTLCIANAGGSYGMVFTPAGAPANGTYTYIQLINTDSRTENTVSCTSSKGIDTAFPYGGIIPGTNPPQALDAPGVPLPNGYTVNRSFNATMFLMWKSNLANSILVPIGYQTWAFNGTAAQVSGKWVATTNGTPGPIGAFVQSSGTQSSDGYTSLQYGYPLWTNVATESCN